MDCVLVKSSMKKDHLISTKLIWNIQLQKYEKLYSRFHNFKFFVSADSWAYKLTNLRKLPTLIQPELFQFLSSFGTYLWDTHNSTNISEIHAPGYSYGVGQKFPYQLPFS